MGMVPTVFGDCERYRRTMLPLFLQELWLQSLKDGSSRSVSVEVSSRSYEDSYIDLDLLLQGMIGPDFRLNETDVVVLRLPDSPKAVLARVMAFKKRMKDSALKVRILASADLPGLGVKSRWILSQYIS